MTETPNSALKESISALCDGESNDLDLQRVLKSMDDADADQSGDKGVTGTARETWSRYQMISAVMKGELRGDQSVDLRVDLSAAIREEIAGENPVKERLAGVNAWWSGLGKTAVAATVTFGVVFAAQKYTIQPVNDAPEIATNTGDAESIEGASVPRGYELPPLDSMTVSTNPLIDTQKDLNSSVKPLPPNTVILTNEFQEQIDRLMFKHAEQVSSSGGMGVIPFARVSELGEEEKASNQ
eukprot:TRINITY_DN42402_c0_g1_i15.p1 TRINITY_DN42402_c0_g1~~TRINITY_DN42402_c0_g1_i15.p1  ORF type:complete len:240 (+),score=31.52 TRINITY_DN42402_c0_g1_i15:291-1010(+)